MQPASPRARRRSASSPMVAARAERRASPASGRAPPRRAAAPAAARARRAAAPPRRPSSATASGGSRSSAPRRCAARARSRGAGPGSRPARPGATGRKRAGHQVADAVAHEQVVLEADEEARLARVALAAGAAAQLVVDAPALVPVGADDVEAAERRPPRRARARRRRRGGCRCRGPPCWSRSSRRRGAPAPAHDRAPPPRRSAR